MIITRRDKKNAVIDVSLEEGDNFSLLSNLPGFKKWDGRRLVFRPTGVNIIYINRYWPQAEWRDSAQDWITEFIAAQKTAEENRVNKAADLSDDGGYKYKRPPMEHQRKGFLLTRDREYYGLFCEAGTGKTKIIFDTAAYLYSQGKITGMAVVAWPNGVHRNWVETEMPDDLPDWCPVTAAVYSSNLTKTKMRELSNALNAPDCLRIITYAAESFASEKAQANLLMFLASGPILLVIDQSACIKNPQAKRTKFFLKKAGPMAAYRRILDGDPNAGGAPELYSQFSFLSQSILGHDTWTSFRNEYCEIGWFNEVKGIKNQAKLREAIDGFSYRVLEKDCLDLPERIWKRWRFDLSSEERRIFEELRDESMAELNEEIIANTLPMVINLRMQQVASGWWPAKEVRMIEPSVPSRMAAFRDMLKEHDPIAPGAGKMLIYSRFRRDIELLKAELGAAALSYYGDDSEEQRAENKVRFQEDPEIRYLIGQQQAMGIGLTLTAAEFIVFYANHPSLRLRTESEKRAHRKGQDRHVKVIDLVANHTKDEKTLRMFRQNKDAAEAILGDPKSFFLEE